MPTPGEKAKLLDLLDAARADRLAGTSHYTIEIYVTKSPKKGIKCGGITVFQKHQVIDENLNEKLNPATFDAEDLAKAQAVAQEIADDLNQQTETIVVDPILFRETEGRWIGWAIDKALELWDSYHGNASIVLKCPKLKIRAACSAQTVAARRANPLDLFPIVQHIDALLDGDFVYDPWTRQIRRGRVGADMAKR